jgi:hypothetical protein
VREEIDRRGFESQQSQLFAVHEVQGICAKPKKAGCSALFVGKKGGKETGFLS